MRVWKEKKMEHSLTAVTLFEELSLRPQSMVWYRSTTASGR